MSFVSRNHPQQVAVRGALDEVDDRGTDPAFFAALSERFGGFTIDVAAAPHNAKADRYFTRQDDGLIQSWAGERLLPANRVEQAWWQEWVEPYRDRPGSPLRVEFLRGRMRFDRPNAVIGPKGDRPPFGCCLLIWGGRG